MVYFICQCSSAFCLSLTPGSSHVYDLVLGGVKLHIPLVFPCHKSVQVSLQAVTVSLWFNLQVNGSVVSEETHLRVDVLGEVVNVGQEQNRPEKDRTLRDPRCHRDLVWIFAPTTIVYWRLLKTARVEPLMPYGCNFGISFEWFTLSKAFEKSSKIKSVCLPCEVFDKGS